MFRSKTARCTKPAGDLARSPERVLVWVLGLLLSSILTAFSTAAETGAREKPREFDPFDILAWEILAGIDASSDSRTLEGAGEEEQLRIAIRPFAAGQGPLPAGFANEYNDKLLVSLLSQGGYRYRFIAREALGAVIKEIDESSSREAELDNLLAALVESAKADVLVVGKLRRTSDDAAVLAYEAVRVRDGTILAATSHQRLAVDPAAVEIAARSEALDELARRNSPPRADDRLDFPIGLGETEPLGPSPSNPALANPDLTIPDPVVASVQAGLRKLGYDPGPVDGIYGSQTRTAIRDYQHDKGLTTNGQPSAALTESLRRDLAGPNVKAAKAQSPSPLSGPNDRYLPKIYGSDGTYCREFQQKLRIGGREESGYGRACLQADGSWKIAK